jgi:hypothetical protein
MPLTEFQKRVGRLLARHRSPDSYLAGGAALHFTPNSTRYSNDLDFFHDSEERVAEAFAQDSALLRSQGLTVQVELNQPGYIRATVSDGLEATKIEWADDSAWRFMPVIHLNDAGYVLHPVDLAVNKVLALSGRDEPRDFLDILYIDQEILSMGALVWAAVGKDPGFTPVSLLELLKRRGRYRHEDFSRLHLAVDLNLLELKDRWLAALDRAERFVNRRPPSEAGCLYYSRRRRSFVEPEVDEDLAKSGIELHYGRPGGVLPRFYQGDRLADSLRRIEL